jgi:hypothetical protein
MATRDKGTCVRVCALIVVSVAVALMAAPAVSLGAGGGIAGKVTEEPGNTPIQGIEACASTSNALEEGGGLGESGCAPTNAAGEYEIEGLNAGGYVVFFSLPLVTTLNFVGQYYDGKALEQEATPVSVAEGAITPHIDAALEPGAELEGTVTSAGTGAGLEGAFICAIRVVEPEPVACTKSGAGGSFTLAGLPGGTFYIYFFYVAHEEFGNGYLSGASTLAEATPLTVAAREVRTGLTEALALGGLPLGEHGPSGGESTPGGGPIGPGAGPKGGSGPIGRGLALAATRITVGPVGEARVAVVCMGAASCHGRVVLRERQAAHHGGSRVLGAVSYVVKAGKRQTLEVRLDSHGRSELRARHGRLLLHAVIVQSAPPPAGVSVKEVLLVSAPRGAAHG